MEESLKYLVAGVMAPLFWVLVFAVPLWLTRKLFPRAEKYLFGPLYNVGWLMGRAVRRVFLAVRRHG